MRVLFIDPKTNHAYDGDKVRRLGIRGTQGSLVRVAEGLAEHHWVGVAQDARQTASINRGVHYLPMDDALREGPEPDAAIVLRKYRAIPQVRTHFPNTRLYCWIHNWQRKSAPVQRAWLSGAGASLITVSDAHRQQADRMVNNAFARGLAMLCGKPGRIPTHRIYNPVSEDFVGLTPDHHDYDPDQLIFFSVPSKGLNQVLHHFRACRQVMPSLKLNVAGIDEEGLARRFPWLVDAVKQEGVKLLGRLPHSQLLEHIRRSLCVFYPQTVRAETFGLIYAEANAVGTPVLAHDFGSAREVLSSPEQLVNAKDQQAVIRRLKQWREGSRPRVSLSPLFLPSTVTREWLHFLDQPESDGLTPGDTAMQEVTPEPKIGNASPDR
ncbi:glycosyltransferase involved in cell wall biosynthesis [Natronospira proteinivora]|uniref:Glycosyltransferase involved in cell wall biosynthesis n=1 Tax=Natronospira proteinivora TaxID=1807133 RepID=A0ABT1G784_9GAMM|nr:glycosyltransferase [Natronospira proteinivora]MCP1726188.1 glycosyltransferase involved in cell wall biosynthesis [Natronospira proteinivora]